MTRLLPIFLILTAARGPDPVGFEAAYLYNLSTNFGALPLRAVALSYDPAHHELYVTGDGPVRVFNDSGMEVYSFGDSPDLGVVRSIAPTEDGDLLALAYRMGRLALVRCSFRGDFLSEIVPRNVPGSLESFRPSVMRYAAGKIYLADQAEMQVLVLDETGEYVASYDVAEKLGEVDKRAQLGLRGFSVDREGNVLFTIQPLFRAYLMTPAGEVRGFGERGSAPGKFNIVGGIARDEAGYVYVTDILKSAVLVFDPALKFVKEFGYRGRAAGSLAAPEDVVAADAKLFVSNRGRKGVSVFRVGMK
jgi:DNA-binding beta-propeller fold protein YncE